MPSAASVGTAAVAALAVSVLAAPHPQGTSAPFPPRLTTYFDQYIQLDQASRTTLLAGRPVTRLVDSDPSKEVAVFGAVWIDAPISSYLNALKDIERFESGQAFRVTKKISTPPRIEDFARLELPADDIQDLKTCRVGDCQLKLSEEGIERVRRGVQWNGPAPAQQVNLLARQVALEYVRGYLEDGNRSLAVYRDSSRPTFVAQEFAAMIDRLPALTDLLPAVRTYLLDFPHATLANSTSFIYWQETRFGLKPTIRINHLTIAEQASGAVVVSKMIYASHYFWTALELRILVSDPQRGPGFWFVTESRSRSDGLSGFTGRIIRAKVRGEAEKGTAAILALTKATLEARGR